MNKSFFSFKFFFLFLSFLDILYFFSLDLKIRSNSEYFLFDYLLNTPFLTLYSCFNINSISLIFILLTQVIIWVCIVWSENFNWNINIFIFFFIFLYLLLKGCFFSCNLFTFFLFFESILLSIFFFIGILGEHKRKVKAIYLFYVYTLLGSFFLLLSILLFIFETGSTNLLVLNLLNLSLLKQVYFWPLLCLSFLIKIPVFPFHLWLPEAHVEASTIGSVLLAAILLKLGGFGLFKFVIPTLPFASFYFTPLIEVLSCLGFVYGSISALRQLDFKKIIAYSSVVHMHLVLFSLFSFSLFGLLGSVLLMVSHGLTSAGIFFCLGVLYDRLGTRNILYIKCIFLEAPLFSVFFFLLILSNISFPGSLNFISELICLIGIFFMFKSLNIVFIFIGLVLNTYYNFLLFNRLIFGNLYNPLPLNFFFNFFHSKFKNSLNRSNIQDLSFNEYLVLKFLLILIFYFGFFPGYLIVYGESLLVVYNIKILS